MTSAAPFRLLLRKTDSGWIVEGAGYATGPFSHDNALNLAEGMVEAVRQMGECAELVIEEQPEQRLRPGARRG